MNSRKENLKKEVKEAEKALKWRNAKQRLSNYVPGNEEIKRKSFLNGSSDHLIQNNEKLSEKLTQKSKRNKLSPDLLSPDSPDYSLSTCFVCEKSDRVLMKCSFIQCTKHYHADCINQYECSNQLKNFCPLHTCLTCYREHSNNSMSRKGAMVTCIRCPTAFHSRETCIPAGSVEVDVSKIICPFHFVGKERNSHQKPCNVNYCSICGQGGELVCCEACPTSVHQNCLKTEIPSEDYYCEDCTKRKYLLYGMIVWGKFGKYRWWPGKIIHPSYLPENVKKLPHYDGEFAVQYYGTRDYSWMHSGRVYRYTELHKNCSAITVNKFGKYFELGLKEAAEAFDEYEKNHRNKRSEAYKHIQVNRALSPAQIFICDANEMLQCSCDPSKANPCGLESECLNRSMLMECHPDVCKAKNLCQNQKFQRRQYVSTKIFKTENCGWGLKTLQDVKKGEFVIEYVGEIITHEEYRRRYREKEKSSNFYFLYLDSRRMIDAGPMGNYARFINHSCGPNCEMIKWSVNGDARIGIFALRKIHAGEELTFNYQSGKYVKYEFEQKCLCSSVNCSGFIGEKNESSQKKPRKKSIKECEKAIKSRNAKVKPKNYVPVNKETKRLSYLNGKGCADHLTQNNGTSSEKPARNSKKVKLSSNPLPRECFLCKKNDANVSCSGVCSKLFHSTCLGKMNVPKNFKCPDCSLRAADLLIQNNGTSSEKATRNSKKVKLSCDLLSRECFLCKKNDANISCLGVCSKFFHSTCLGKTNVPKNFKCPDCSLRDADLLIQNNGTSSEKATRNSKEVELSCDPLCRECFLCKKNDANVSCLGVCSKFFHSTCLGKMNVPKNFKCPDCSLRDADLLIQNNGSSSEKATRNSKKVKLSSNPLPRECFLCKKNDATVSCSGVCSKLFHSTCLGKTNVPENFKCSDCSLRDADLLIQNNGTSFEKATRNSKKVKLSCDPLSRECFLCKKNDANVSCLGVCSKFFHSTCLGKTNVPENFKCPDCALRDADLLIQNNGTSSEKAIHQSEKIKLPRICFLCKKSEADISCLGVCANFFHLSCLGKTNVPENFKCPDCSLRSADPVIQNVGTSSEKSNQIPETIKLSCDPLPSVCDICKISDTNIPYFGIGSKIFHLTCLDKSNLPENFKCPNCSLRDTDLLIQNNETSSEKATQSSKKNKLSHDPLASVCDVCKKDDADIACLGICSKFFHLACLGKTSVPENFKCPDCSISDYTCFVCEKSNGYLVQCSFINCTKHYHTYCINQYECTNQTKNICPLHTCLTCYRENSNNPLSHTGAMVTCIRCPTSFHSDETCIPAGSVEVEMSKIICSLHFIGNERISPRKSCNVNYCIICGQDGDLVCCKACPTSVHQSCKKIPNSSEDYTCNDCLQRKYLLYGMIVWGKFGSFRWWPAQIIHPSYLPNNVKKQAHYDGEFVIRYFGTHDYSWTHSGRVYPYTESHKNYPRTKINKCREEFEIGLEEAAKAFDEYEENRQIVGLLGKRHKAYKHLRCLVKYTGSGSKSSIYKTTIPKPSASSVFHPVQSGKMPDNLVLTPSVRLTRIDLLNSFEHNSINIASVKLNEIGKEKKYLSLLDEKKSDNHCFSCRNPGTLVLCDKEGCNRAFHLRCVNMPDIPTGKWICPLHFCFICKKSSSIFCVLCSTSYCSVCWSLESNSKPHTCEVCKVKFDSQKKI